MKKSNDIVINSIRTLDPGVTRIFHIDFVKINVTRNEDYPALLNMRFEYDGHLVEYPFISDVNNELDRMLTQGIKEIYKLIMT